MGVHVFPAVSPPDPALSCERLFEIGAGRLDNVQLLAAKLLLCPGCCYQQRVLGSTALLISPSSIG